MLRERLDNRVLKLLLSILAIISVGTVIYATLTYGRATIDSDVSLVYRFYNSVISNKSIFPSSWNAVNGEIYSFSRLPINLLVLCFIKDTAFAIELSNVIVLILSVMSIIWFSKKYLNNDSWCLIVTLFCSFLFGENARRMLFFHGAYCPGVIVFTFVFGLFWLVVLGENKKRYSLIIYGVFLFLMILGGKRLIAEYLLPTVATYVIYYFFAKKDREKKQIIKSASLLLIPSVLGFVIYRLVCATHNMNFGGNSNPSIDFNGILINLKTVVVNIYSIFGYSSERTIIYKIVSLLFATLICLIIPIMQTIEYKKLSEKERILFVFMVIHNAELILIITLCGLLQIRYCLSTVFMCVVISSNYCYKKLTENRYSRLKTICVCGFVLITFGLCRDLVKLTTGWADKYAAQTQIGETLIEHGITKGYASFWNGYPNEVYTNGELVFGGVDLSEASLMKQYSNCDNSCYEYIKGKSCVLLTQEEWDYYYSVDGQYFINDLIGEPVEAFSIDNPLFADLYDTSRFIVYVFEDDVCDMLTDGLKDGVLIPRELSANATAKREKGTIKMEPDAVVHGPYKKIAPGEYLVTYKGKGIIECDIDIVSESLPNSVEYELVDRGDDEIKVKLTVSNYIEDIQFYINNNTNKICQFNEIDIVKQ